MKEKARMDRNCGLREVAFIGSFPDLCVREAILRSIMEQVGNVFMEKSLMMKTLSLSILKLVYSQWQTEVKTPTALSFL